MNINEADKCNVRDITESLLDEYTDSEVEKMLDKATFKYVPNGLIVEYENGAVDQFVSITKLIHIDDYNKRKAT